MSNAWDYAIMGLFFSTIKSERMDSKHYATGSAPNADVFDFVDRFSNPRRRQRALGNLVLVSLEQAMAVA